MFAGTPAFALPALEKLSVAHDVVAVLTAPDRKKGRGKHASPSAVAEKASDLGLTTIKPERLDAAARQRVAECRPELLVVVAYGKIFGPKFVALFPEGGVNLHPSLLPEFRGPAPIPAAILAGVEETGSTVQRIALNVDSGAILEQYRYRLDAADTAASVTGTLSRIGSDQLIHTLERFESGSVDETPQDESRATYCRLINKADGVIDWGRPAAEIERMVRAFDPWPTAYSWWNGRLLSILKASLSDATTPPLPRSGGSMAPGEVVGVDKSWGILIQTGTGTIAAEQLQLQSKRRLHFTDFLNGAPQIVGSLLGRSV